MAIGQSLLLFFAKFPSTTETKVEKIDMFNIFFDTALSPKLFVALNAKVRNGRERNKFFIFRAMGAMTTQTIHCHILISRIRIFLTNGMGGMGHPLMALTAKLEYGLFLKEKLIVR